MEVSGYGSQFLQEEPKMVELFHLRYPLDILLVFRSVLMQEHHRALANLFFLLFSSVIHEASYKGFFGIIKAF